MTKKRKMTRAEAGRKGGRITYARHGSEHMAQIGSLGFWASMESIEARHPTPASYKGNPYRNLLQNLMKKK